MDSTDVAAVVALATIRMFEGRLEEAHALLSNAHEAVPGDPSIPLLLAVTDERRGELQLARSGYSRYRSTRYGILARRAEERLVATSPAAVRLEVADLLRAPVEERPPLDPNTVAVLPLLRPVDEDIDAEGAAVAALVASNLSSEGWNVVEASRVRAVLGEMGFAATARAELSTGVEVGRTLGAGRVVQGVARRVSLDTIAWDVTVTSMDSATALRVDVISLSGATGQPGLMLQSLASRVDRALGGQAPVLEEPNAPGTFSSRALVAFGAGLLAVDRSDWEAAHSAFVDAVALDGGFDEAVAMAALAEVARDAPPVDSLVAEVARVGSLQRVVHALREVAGQSDGGASLIGASDRAIISDLMGLDALTGRVPIDVTLALPGGGR